MKILFLTGSHPRHLYIAKKLYKAGFLNGLLIEKRDNFILQPPKNLLEVDRNNFIRHFRERAESELKWFGELSDIACYKEIRKIIINKEELNTNKVIEWISASKPDVVISYGIH